jgi:predicted transposase YdaD
MDISEKMRLIEKLHAERDEARARAAEFEKAREEDRRALDKERRAREETLERFRDTARNILRLGLPVEQVAQATGLPPETVGELAAQL